MSGLSWQSVVAEEVVLAEPTVAYQDDLPLSDIVVADNGAICCARRIPGLAEVLVWPDGLSGRPVSWTGSPTLPILRMIGFDGSVAYAFSETQLLRIRPGSVDVLHTTRASIREAWLSPDSERLLWLEHAGRAEGYLASLAIGLHPSRLRIEEYCYGARWLTSSEVVLLELHQTHGAEAGQSLRLCDLGGRVVATAFRVSDFVLQFGPVDHATRSVYLFGGATAPVRAQDSRAVGAWDYDVATMTSSCTANAQPAGGTAQGLSDGCLFADASAQTAVSSRLVFASPAGCRTACVEGFLREFAVSFDARNVLFRTFDDRFGIAELAIDPLVRGRGRRTTGCR